MTQEADGMKVKLLYGPPCGGKTTHIRENAEKQDAVWDSDLVILACSNIGLHTTEKLKISSTVYYLRKKFVEDLARRDCVDTLWFACRYPTDYVMSILDGLDIEKIPMVPDKETCYKRLENDDTRPDKDEWKAVIDSWYEEFGDSEQQKDERRPEPVKNRFWRWVKNKTPTNAAGGAKNEGRTLFLDGVIDDEAWWGDEVTPKAFRDELFADSGDVTIWINSPGGSVFAADQIYNMLRDYHGKVTVKIDAIAASAASVIAMAGDEVQMSPVATMMIHNPATIAMGNSEDLAKAIQMLDTIKESILNAYMIKTGLSHKKLSDMMDAETFLDAKQCVALGFADALITRGEEKDPDEDEPEKDPDGTEEDEPAEGEPQEDPEKDPEEGEEQDPDEETEEEKSKQPQKASLLFSGMLFTADRAEKITAYCKEHMDPKPAEKKEGCKVSDMLSRLDLLRQTF